MHYTELELVNLFVNNVDIGVDYSITNHELSDFFNSKTTNVPKEFKYIERELLSIRDLYPETIKWCRHSYYLYIAAILTSIHNEGLEVSDKAFEYLKKHWCLVQTILEFTNFIIMVYLPQRVDYLLYERDNRNISRARLYHRIGHNLDFANRGGIINEHEKDFFELIKGYDYMGPFYIRTMLIGFYYINHELYNLSLESLKKCLDNTLDLVVKMNLNGLNYENIDENMILNYFQNSLNKIIIK